MDVRILVRRVLSTTATVVAFLIVTAIGELLPFMGDLDAAINRARGTYLGLAATALVLGFSGFMGGVIYGAIRSAGPTDRENAIDGPRQAAGRAFNVEVTFREMKDAWREEVAHRPGVAIRVLHHSVCGDHGGGDVGPGLRPGVRRAQTDNGRPVSLHSCDGRPRGHDRLIAW